MQLAEQLHAMGVPVFPCSAKKVPAVTGWQTPLTPDQYAWNSPYVGVPVPPGVFVIDLDTYKGVTRQHVEQALGCTLPWDAAHIQMTQSGGEHYAFAAPEWPVRQGSNLFGVDGFDSRAAGRGFIVTGDGYSSVGFGVFALAQPTMLPPLPDEARGALERTATNIDRPELPDGDPDIDRMQAALAYIDPNDRDVWFRIGCGIHFEFHADSSTGFAIFDAWSAGEYWADGCPDGYNPETQESQWHSMNPYREGPVTTAGTLYHMAAQAGWVPPASFDVSLAFGPSAAPAETYSALVDLIHESGSDTRQTEVLIAAIQHSGCNELQATLLRNELKTALKQAGILDKTLTAQIDKQLTPNAAATPAGQYGKNHTENATLFLSTQYPNDTLTRIDEVWYAYDGRSWAEVPDDTLRHQITMAMLSSRPQDSVTTGTYSLLCKIVHAPGRHLGDTPDNLLIYQNGVLDIHTGHLHPHSPAYFTTKILPYDFSPNAPCSHWHTFLHEVFEGDHERIALLQEWFGYMVSGSYEHQKIMLMIGPKRCGKGTIGRVMERMVGSLNFTGGSLMSFASNAFLDSLRGKSVLFSGDTAKNIGRQHVDVVIERIKKISGNDAVSFDRKYKSTLSCTLPTRITLAANHIPKLFDDSGALSGRMLVLPYYVSFFGREDTALTSTLLTEIEGIAIWALQGLARLNTNGRFTVPAVSRDEADFIDETYNPLSVFIEEVCTLGGDGAIECGELHNAYKLWATAHGEDHQLGRRPFITAFKDATRGQGCRYGSHRSGSKIFRGFDGLAVTAPNATPFTPQLVK